MKIKSVEKVITCLGIVAVVTLSADPIRSVNFEGDYGGNRNSALGNNIDFHFEDQGDFNGDGITDTRRFIPLLFPYPGIGEGEGPIGLNFQIDQNLFGKNGFFYTGAQVVRYGGPSGQFPRFGLYRWGAGPQAIQITSGLTDVATGDMGLLAAIVVTKRDFLNGANEIEDLRLPNAPDAFSAEVFFRGAPKVDASPNGFRRARFIIRAGDVWYVSQSGTESDVAPIARDVTRSLALNPAAEYWHLYDEQAMLFIAEDAETAIPKGSSVRGDSLVDIRAVGVIMQNTRFDGLIENHYVWLNFNEFRFYLDPDPDPIIDTPEPWIDTGDWLGLLYVVNSPWVFSTMLNRWIFLPEEGVSEEGGWAYILR